MLVYAVRPDIRCERTVHGGLVLGTWRCGAATAASRRVTREQSSDKTELIHKEGPETDAHDAGCRAEIA